uniref:LTD domain-containing protein n=1 Tax=Mesocestoides corti TaxID=53468 RepID=A0A5K3FWI0_MESCO
MKHRPPVSVDYDEEDEGIHSACTSSPLAGLTHATYRVTAHGNGSVEFAADQDERFKCVKLINTSGDEINIGNWVLQQLVSDHEVTYKFHRSTTLKPGATCQALWFLFDFHRLMETFDNVTPW